jgi:hypothetical protein
MHGHPDSQGEGGFSLPDGLLSVVAALVGGHAIVGIQPVEGPLALADGIPGELGMGVGELVGQAGVVVAVAGVQVAAEAAGDLVEGPVADLAVAHFRLAPISSASSSVTDRLSPGNHSVAEVGWCLRVLN